MNRIIYSGISIIIKYNNPKSKIVRNIIFLLLSYNVQIAIVIL